MYYMKAPVSRNGGLIGEDRGEGVTQVFLKLFDSYLPLDFVVDQSQAVKFALDMARGMAFLHTLEPLIPRHALNSRSVMVRLPNSLLAQSPKAFAYLEWDSPPSMYLLFLRLMRT